MYAINESSKPAITTFFFLMGEPLLTDKNHSIESTFSYKDRKIDNIVIKVKIDDRRHDLRYEPHEKLDDKEVREEVHVTPMQWDHENRNTKDTHYFNATADKITELMLVKRIAEERVTEKGFKLARYREEEE